MDLRLMTAEPTAIEQRAVDGVLGEPDSGWVGGDRRPGDGRLAVGGHSIRERRHLLLPALHAVQSSIGWISEGALNYICRRLSVPPAEAYGVATFYAMFSTVPEAPTRCARMRRHQLRRRRGRGIERLARQETRSGRTRHR